MRLVRIALANVNSTVGACRSNVDRAIGLARAAAADGATLVALPEQLIGGYPPEDLVQWRAFVDAQRVELARFARETATLGCACALGLVVVAGLEPLQRGRAGPRRPGLGLRPEGEAPALQRLLRGADAGARRAGSLRHARRRPLRRPRLRPRLRHRRPRGLRGRLVARRPDATALVRRRRGRPQPERLAVPPRHRRDAPRDDRDARRRLPGDGRLREPRRRQRRARVRRRRLRRAERPPAAHVVALPRGRRGGHARPRPHPPPAHREHDLARRPGGLRRAGAEGDARARRRAHPGPGSAGVHAAREQELLPAPGRVAPDRARRVLRGAARRARPGPRRLLREDRRVQDDRRRALRAVATASSCSPSRAAGSTSAGPIAPPPTDGPRPGRSCARSTCPPASRRPRRAPRPSASRADLDVPLAIVSIEEAFERELAGRREDAAARRGAHVAGAPERAGARARRAHVDVGQRRAGPLPADEQHEREGRRLRRRSAATARARSA